MSLMRAVTALATVRRQCSASKLSFSTTLPAASAAFDKFKGVLREYRLANFDHSMPKRYVKEFVRGVDKNHDSYLEKDDFSSFLDEIGASGRLTSEELDQAMTEMLGVRAKQQELPRVPVQKMQDIMLEGIHRGDM